MSIEEYDKMSNFGKRLRVAGIAAGLSAGFAWGMNEASSTQTQTEPAPVTEAITEVNRITPFHPHDEVIGDGVQNYLTTGSETLMELARAYGLGFNAVALANPLVKNRHLPKNSQIKLSTQWILPEASISGTAVVVNIPEMRLYHRMNGGNSVETFPTSVGKHGWETPILSTTVVGKQVGPAWYVPESILKEKPDLSPVVPPGPENPLGTHAILLGGVDYLIHGTNQPMGIGRRVSHGCMRLYPEDIIKFFKSVQVGEEVQLVNEPVKAGWKGDVLYVEIHPPLERDENLRVIATQAVNKAFRRNPDAMVAPDWQMIDQLADAPDGMPHPVSLPFKSTKVEAINSSALQ